jgi:hypothetical protein
VMVRQHQVFRGSNRHRNDSRSLPSFDPLQTLRPTLARCASGAARQYGRLGAIASPSQGPPA